MPGVVLDPFVGSGTRMKVATALGRSAIGIDINPGYVGLVRQRVPNLKDADVVYLQRESQTYTGAQALRLPTLSNLDSVAE